MLYNIRTKAIYLNILFSILIECLELMRKKKNQKNISHVNSENFVYFMEKRISHKSDFYDTMVDSFILFCFG